MTDRRQFNECDFVKSSRSNQEGTTDCVRVARAGDQVSIRDDKKSWGAADDFHFLLTSAEFDAFQDEVREDAISGLLLSVEFNDAAGMFVVRSTVPQPQLPEGAEMMFTRSEIEAFFAAVHDREFDNNTVAA